MGLCQHGVACPRVADGGDGLQIRRKAANKLNKQSRTANKGWSSRLRVGEGLTTPRHKKQPVIKCYTGPRKWGSCKHGNEPSGSIKGG